MNHSSLSYTRSKRQYYWLTYILSHELILSILCVRFNGMRLYQFDVCVYLFQAPFKFIDRVFNGLEIQQYGDGTTSRGELPHCTASCFYLPPLPLTSLWTISFTLSTSSIWFDVIWNQAILRIHCVYLILPQLTALHRFFLLNIWY